MKKLAMIILTTLLILLLFGCGGSDEAVESDIPDSKPETNIDDDPANSEDQNKETEYSGEMVPETNVFIYPNSEQVYKTDDTIVYATDDTAEMVNDFYKDNPNIRTFRASEKKWYTYSTPLNDLMLEDRGAEVGRWTDEQEAEINACIKEAGQLTTITIYDGEMEDEFKKMSLDSISSELPDDKTVMIYTLHQEP